MAAAQKVKDCLLLDKRTSFLCAHNCASEGMRKARCFQRFGVCEKYSLVRKRRRLVVQKGSPKVAMDATCAASNGASSLRVGTSGLLGCIGKLHLAHRLTEVVKPRLVARSTIDQDVAVTRHDHELSFQVLQECRLPLDFQSQAASS
jgi:hypothetical protein